QVLAVNPYVPEIRLPDHITYHPAPVALVAAAIFFYVVDSFNPEAIMLTQRAYVKGTEITPQAPPPIQRIQASDVR
ncbi:MAG TPA: hypothetical protein VF508_00800, partial [Pyrinomonadaceae bacterium]